MRAVIQRTNHAAVVIDGKLHAEIGTGMLVLVGISRTDAQADAEYLAQRIPRLRIFQDAAGKMNLDINEVRGSLLVVPNFTLYGDCRKGRRPSFDAAMSPRDAKPLFEYLVMRLRETGVKVETGIFGEDMQVRLVNAGPVTLVIDSP
jgi:D-tyrosyl-tRNA(Tyr) deacylase